MRAITSPGVRTDVQPQNAVGVLILGGDHQDGHGRYRADAAAHLQPIDARKHDVQQDDSRVDGVKQGQRFLAAARGKHGPAFVLDVFGQDLKDLLVVIHYEDGIHIFPSVCKMMHLL